jgi:tetratricopeptide (TPR) repeat protein
VFGNLRMGSAPNMLHVQLCLKDSFGNLISNKEGEVAENGIQAFVADAAKQFRGAIGDAGAGAIPDLRGIYPEDAEARRLYFEGVSELRKLNARDAIQSLQKAAAREDSNALIHAALADSWEALRHDEEASIEAKAAIDHANQPSAFPLPIEYRDGINARAAEINRDWKQAITNYESLYRSFPQRIDYGLKLASVKTAGSEGQSALDTLKELTKLPLPLGKDPRIFIEQSRTYEALGDSSGAVKAAETAVHLAEDRKWHVLSGMALLQLCRAHHELADTNPESDCGKAQKIFEVFGNEVLAAVALNDMAVWLTDQGRYDEARAIYGRVRKITGDAGSKMDSAGALVNLARTYIFQEQPEKAEPLLKDSLAISTASDVKDQYDEALARQSLAHIYWEAGRIVDSGEQASQALDLARKIGDRSVEAFALGALALAQSETGDLRGALENYGQCLKIRQTLQQQAEITIAWTRLGDVNFRMGNFDAADGYYGDALKSFQEQGSANAVQMQVNLAHVDLERNKFPEAGSEAEAALTAMDKDDKESRADGLSFLVRALLGQKNLSAAEERHKEMKDLPVSDLEVVTDVGIADGEFLSASGRADEAAKQLKDSAEQLEKSGRRFSALQLQLAETAALAKAGKRREAASLLHQLREAAGQCTANLTPRPRCGFDLISQKAAAIQKSLRL